LTTQSACASHASFAHTKRRSNADAKSDGSIDVGKSQDCRKTLRCRHFFDSRIARDRCGNTRRDATRRVKFALRGL